MVKTLAGKGGEGESVWHCRIMTKKAFDEDDWKGHHFFLGKVGDIISYCTADDTNLSDATDDQPVFTWLNFHELTKI